MYMYIKYYLAYNLISPLKVKLVQCTCNLKCSHAHVHSLAKLYNLNLQLNAQNKSKMNTNDLP